MSWLRNAGNLCAGIGAIIVIAIMAVIAQGQAPAPILDGFGNGVTTFGGPCCAPGASPPSDFHIVHGVTTRPSDNMATDYRVATIFDQASSVHSLAGTVLQQMVNSVSRFQRTIPGAVLPVDFPLVPASEATEPYMAIGGPFEISASQATIIWSNWR